MANGDNLPEYFSCISSEEKYDKELIQLLKDCIEELEHHKPCTNTGPKRRAKSRYAGEIGVHSKQLINAIINYIMRTRESGNG